MVKMLYLECYVYHLLYRSGIQYSIEQCLIHESSPIAVNVSVHRFVFVLSLDKPAAPMSVLFYTVIQ